MALEFKLEFEFDVVKIAPSTNWKDLDKFWREYEVKYNDIRPSYWEWGKTPFLMACSKHLLEDSLRIRNIEYTDEMSHIELIGSLFYQKPWFIVRED